MNRVQLNKLYNHYIGKVFPNLMGEGNYSIYRPDYAALDNEPSLIASNLIMRVDPGASRYVESPFFGVQYYSIFYNRNIIQAGDLLVYGTYDSPRIDRPYITFLHLGPEKEAVGVRTSKKCHLSNGRNQTTGAFEYIAENVWYDFVEMGSPQGRINEGNSHSPRVPNQNIVIYSRSIELDLRTLVIDIDPQTGAETGLYWVVKQIDQSGQMIIFNVEQDLGSY